MGMCAGRTRRHPTPDQVGNPATEARDTCCRCQNVPACSPRSAGIATTDEELSTTVRAASVLPVLLVLVDENVSVVHNNANIRKSVSRMDIRYAPLRSFPSYAVVN